MEDISVIRVNGTAEKRILMLIRNSNLCRSNCIVGGQQQPTSFGGLNIPMLVLAVFSAIGGFLFGYDTGVVSGAMLLVREEFDLSTFWHESIVSGTIAAAWLASLCAGPLADRFGRRPVILLGSAFFIVGAVVMAVAPNKELLLTGRIIVGLAIGLASMCVPLYLSETAEAAHKGSLTVVNIAFVTGGQFVASVVCGALASIAAGWRWMFGVATIPAVVQLFAFIYLPETPRWLIGKGKADVAQAVLRRLRPDTSNLAEEFKAMEDASNNEKEEQSYSLAQILRNAPVRRALILGCLLQLFQQLAGINTVMYYSASIITMAGVSDKQTAIWMAAAVSSCNFIFTFLGLFLVERIGRRKLLLISLFGVVICLLELAISFNLAYLHSPEVGLFNISVSCSEYRFCSDCTFAKECGFCFSSADESYSNSSCLPSDETSYNEVSLTGPCSGLTESEYVFAYDWCPSNFAWTSIVGLAAYLLCFAPGMGPMPWTINSEMFPGWARARCVALATSVNWASNLLVSLTFLSLTQLLNKHGTFYLYSCLAASGWILFYWTLPETRGTSLENVVELFQKPLLGKQPRH